MPCVTAKEFLSSRGVEYEEKNIRQDPDALRHLVEGLRSTSTPTLVVGERVLIGFDPVEYSAALGL
jgi:glutaredoxin